MAWHTHIQERSLPQDSEQESVVQSFLVGCENESSREETGEQGEQEKTEQEIGDEDMKEPEGSEQGTEVPDRIELKTDQSNKDDHGSVEPSEPGKTKPEMNGSLEMGLGGIHSSVEIKGGTIAPDNDQESVEPNVSEPGETKPEMNESQSNEHLETDSNGIQSVESNGRKIKPENDHGSVEPIVSEPGQTKPEMDASQSNEYLEMESGEVHSVQSKGGTIEPDNDQESVEPNVSEPDKTRPGMNESQSTEHPEMESNGIQSVESNRGKIEPENDHGSVEPSVSGPGKTKPETDAIPSNEYLEMDSGGIQSVKSEGGKIEPEVDDESVEPNVSEPGKTKPVMNGNQSNEYLEMESGGMQSVKSEGGKLESENNHESVEPNVSEPGNTKPEMDGSQSNAYLEMESGGIQLMESNGEKIEPEHGHGSVDSIVSESGKTKPEMDASQSNEYLGMGLGGIHSVESKGATIEPDDDQESVEPNVSEPEPENDHGLVEPSVSGRDASQSNEYLEMESGGIQSVKSDGGKIESENNHESAEPNASEPGKTKPEMDASPSNEYLEMESGEIQSVESEGGKIEPEVDHESVESNVSKPGKNKPEMNGNQSNEYLEMKSGGVQSVESNGGGMQPEDDHDAVQPRVSEPGKTQPEMNGSQSSESLGMKSSGIQSVESKEGEIEPELIETEEESNRSKDRGEAIDTEKLEELFGPETTEQLVVLLLQLQLGKPKTSESGRADSHEETKQLHESEISGSEIGEPEGGKVHPEQLESNGITESGTVVCNFIWRPKKSAPDTSKSKRTLVCNFIWRAGKLQMGDSEELGQEHAELSRNGEDIGRSYLEKTTETGMITIEGTESARSDLEESDLWDSEEECNQSSEWGIVDPRTYIGKTESPMIRPNSLEQLLAIALSRMELGDSDKGTEKWKSTSERTNGPGSTNLRFSDLGEIIKDVANKPKNEVVASRPAKRGKKRNENIQNLESTHSEQEQSRKGSKGTEEQAKSEPDQSGPQLTHSKSHESDRREEGTMTGWYARKHERIDAIKPETFEEKVVEMEATRPKIHPKKKKKKKKVVNPEVSCEQGESRVESIQPGTIGLERRVEDKATQTEASGSTTHRKGKNKGIQNPELTLSEQERLTERSNVEKIQAESELEQSGSEPIQPESHELESNDEESVSDEYEKIDSETQERARNHHGNKQHEHLKRALLEIKTNVVKIDFMYSLIQSMGIIPAFLPDKKDDKLCSQELMTAIRLAENKESVGALYSSTDAISMAESPKSVALCRVTRSHALYNLGLFSECIGECHKALSDPFILGGPYRRTLEERIEKASLLLPPEPPTYHEEVPKIPRKHQNPRMQSVSDFIHMKSNKEYGRHYVAKNHIDIGQLLLVEDPYASELDLNHRTLHCDHCLELCYVPIPCDTCPSALYCGDACKLEAFDSYHKYECPIRKTIDRIWVHNNKRHSLRIMFKARREIFFGEVPHAEDTGYRSDRFKDFYQFRGRLKDFSVDDQYSICWVVSLLFHFVKHYTDFFEEHDEDKFKEVFLNVYTILVLNTREIRELGFNGLSGIYEYSRFANGSFPALGLFNHSCDANTAVFFYGKTAVVYSIQTIKKGQQCFIAYLPHCFYPQYKTQNRQDLLQRAYLFQCKCIACEKDWPNFDELHETDGSFEQFKRSVDSYDIVYRNITLTLSVPFARRELRTYIKHLRKAEKNTPSLIYACSKMVYVSLLRVMGNKNFALRDKTIDLQF